MTLKAIGYAESKPGVPTGRGHRILGPAESIEWVTPVSLAPSPYDKCGEFSPYLAINTIDGNVDTLWIHYAFCYHWIAFDLGVTRTVSKIRLYQSSSRFGASSTVSVFVSDDPANWGTAVWVGSMAASYWVESGFFSKSGRYVKILSGSNTRIQAPGEFQVGLIVAGTGGPNPGLAETVGPELGGAKSEIPPQGLIVKEAFE